MKLRIEKPAVLHLLANTLLFAAAGRGIPDGLTGVRLNADGRNVWAAATDGTAVGQARAAAYETDGPAWSALIGAQDVLAAVRFIQGARVMSVGIDRVPDAVIFTVNAEHLAAAVLDDTHFPQVETMFPDRPAHHQDFDTVCLNQRNLARLSKIRDYRTRLTLPVQLSHGASKREPILFTAGEDFRGLIMPVARPLQVREAHARAYGEGWAAAAAG